MIGSATGIVALCIALLAAIPSAADNPPAGPAVDTPDDTPQIPVDEPPQPKQGAFPNFVQALRSIDGVVKAEFARMDTGMNCVFAWFEDKDAALRWYYSEVHQNMLDAYYPDRIEREPLFKVPDDVGPMMGLACITISKETGIIEQIAIEVYKPLHGGLSGRRTLRAGRVEGHLRALRPVREGRRGRGRRIRRGRRVRVVRFR